MSLSQLKYERSTSVAPLGLRFWDVAMNAPVESGLVVTAHAANQPQTIARATSGPSGVYGFIHLPGLREFERGRGDAAFWDAMPPPREFVISVTDAQARFHPTRFVAPAPARGIGGLDCTASSPLSSPASPPYPDAPEHTVPLFSAPSRSLPAAMAMIRADLRDADSGGLAAWAMLEAQFEGAALASGLADADGKAALFFPYPSIEPFSPPFSPLLPPSRRSLDEQTWTIELRARFSRLPAQPVPELCLVLNQRPATLFTTLSPPVPLPDVRLEWGREAVVKSQGVSELWVRPSP